MNIKLIGMTFLLFYLSSATVANKQDLQAIVKANFEAADADGNGSLNENEFPALIDANAKYEIGRAAMVKRFGAYKRAFNTADRDGDGEVSWSDLMANQQK